MIDETPGGIDWHGVEAEPAESPVRPLFGDDELSPDDSKPFAVPGPGVLKVDRRPRHSKEYQDKVTDFIQMGVALTAPNKATVVDAAALLLHGDNVALAVGNLAAEDERVAKMVDLISGGTGNVYTATVMATLPLVLQLLRNHEPSLEHVTRLRIPFTKRSIPMGRLKIKLGRARAATNSPEELYNHVFSNEDVMKSLQKKGIQVAPYGRHAANTD